MRNLALHRAGAEIAVKDNLLNPHHPDGEFWLQAPNFLDTCVLEWCKLFADYDGEHHWHRVVDDNDRARFKRDLFAALGDGAEFNQTIKKVKHYRDKFVAHLDEERVMFLPELEAARRVVLFLDEYLAPQLAKEWRGPPPRRSSGPLGRLEASTLKRCARRSGYDPRSRHHHPRRQHPPHVPRHCDVLDVARHARLHVAHETEWRGLVTGDDNQGNRWTTTLARQRDDHHHAGALTQRKVECPLFSIGL